MFDYILEYMKDASFVLNFWIEEDPLKIGFGYFRDMTAIILVNIF